jgi:alkanesulfonate monooxygenase SsuD/methylene tetrahydromethanopterin reductase-like flavin-dependent oxidoreductase (luciferase family)
MDVGIQMVLATYGWQGMSDDQAWDEEIRLARLAEELGFDALWAVEHHFNDYSFCPDNLQLMLISRRCARTSTSAPRR